MSTERKVAVVTGASQGIGGGLVRGFLDKGYRVVANSRSIKPDATADVLVVPGDIADPAVANRVIVEAVAKFGRVDTLVNNAGMFIASRSPSTPRRTSPPRSRSTWPGSSSSPSGPCGRC